MSSGITRIEVRDSKNPAAPYYAVIDDSEYERLVQYKWRAAFRGNNVYAQTSVDDITGRFSAATAGVHKEYMHKMITGYNETDHKNNIGLDNRRENLRQATRAQNNWNARPRGGTSQYKGVYLHKKNKIKCWVASVRFEGKNHFLGNYENEEDAAKAYDNFAAAHYGEFARLNFPD